MNVKTNIMNTTENNKLIAQFMGAEIDGLNYRVVTYDNIKVCMHPNILNYHKDWNWLMKVVETIFLTVDEERESEDDWDFLTKQIKNSFYFPNIEEVYNSCVEFIKWYNQQKN